MSVCAAPSSYFPGMREVPFTEQGEMRLGNSCAPARRKGSWLLGVVAGRRAGGLTTRAGDTDRGKAGRP